MTRQQQLHQLRQLINHVNAGLILRVQDVPSDLVDLPIFTVSEHFFLQPPDVPGLLYLTEEAANCYARSFNDRLPLDSMLRADVETTSLRRILTEG